MAATPKFAFPYPGTGDSPHGPNQLGALALAVENKIDTTDIDRALIKSLLAGFAAPAQTGSGSLTVGGTGVTIMSVAIPDPGFPFHILASGGMGWAMTAATQPNNLLEVGITINSTTYNSNRLTYGCGISFSLGAGFNQPTIAVPEKRSDSFGAQTGAKTVRLIVRNSGAANMTIPAAGPDIALSVRIVPA